MSNARLLSSLSLGTLLLVLGGAQPSCSSTPIQTQQPASDAGSGNGAAVAGSGGSDPGGGGSDAGIAGASPAVCRGSAGTPSAGKACGCDADCDVEQACVPESDGAAGGMCLQLCGASTDCPSTFDCLALTPDDPKKTSSCWQRCTQTSDCRVGYVCGPLSVVEPGVADNGNRCLSWCQSDADCLVTGTCNRYTGECGMARSPGLADIGAACLKATDCEGQACITGLPGGSCSTPCSISRDGCPTGSACAVPQQDSNGVNKGDFGWCIQKCSTDKDCRSGYLCELGVVGSAHVCGT